MSSVQLKKDGVSAEHFVKEYLSIKEVAVILGLSESTIRNMVRDRRLPSIRTGNAQKTVRIAKSDLDAHIAANRIGPGAQSDDKGEGSSHG